jgi:hypothetical protein
MNHPTLHTFVKRDPYEVRHLLLGGNDPGANSLTQIIAGVHSEIATGTQYEMHKRENELMQEWINEGFKEEERAYESWSRTLVLLTAMGYPAIFDPQPRNPVNAVPLARWSGRTAQNGGEYIYAFDGNTLSAQPKLPPMKLNSDTGFAKQMLTVSRLQASLGPSLTFYLAD